MADRLAALESSLPLAEGLTKTQYMGRPTTGLMLVVRKEIEGTARKIGGFTGG